MKLKQQPEDFQVEELTDVVPAADGPFALYRLDKRGWTTADALIAIRRRWKLDANRVSYGGLKDRHAQTTQYFTVFHGPRRNLKQTGIAVSHLGQLSRPYTSRDIQANRFVLVVRDVGESERAGLMLAIGDIKQQGLPNYFDDQRLGSVGETGEFVGRMLLLSDYEGALRAALAGTYAHDRAPQKHEKALIEAHWRDWTTLKQRLPRGHAQRVVDYLVSRPSDFRGAVERLRPDLRGLYLSAYQSHLWNRMLAQWLADNCQRSDLLEVRLRRGLVPMHRSLPRERYEALSALRLPLPSARLTLEPGDPLAALVDDVLGSEGIQLSQFQLRGLRRMFFSKGARPALLMPSELEYEIGADENHAGRDKIKMSFCLPPGSYATLLVKRIFVRSSLARSGAEQGSPSAPG